MKRAIACLVFALAAWPAAQAQQLQLGEAFPGLRFTRPLDIQAPDDGTDRLFVVEQAGRIRVFDNNPGAAQSDVSLFLDIRDRVTSGGERGLLGLAFHPDYAANGYFYVNYTTDQGGPLRTVIARFSASVSDPDAANPGSEQIMLEVEQPFGNHNAGQLQFGPDGYLYVGLGDGGSGGDPRDNGQDLSTLLGAMLRLDVDGGGLPPDCGTNASYTIPADNPFVNNPNACGEIWAYGLRNPFRFSFGPQGRLFAGDVGQGAREEIDLIEKGKNYGWNIMEGTRCYPPGTSCDQTGLTLPIVDYPHDRSTGGFSVTGGYVYTGPTPACSPLLGKYLYADYLSGNIWSLAYDQNGNLVDNTLQIQNASIRISSFGEDAQGELYLTDHSGGKLYRFDCSLLPVELMGFDARVDEQSVLLTWETASETNNAGFEIEQKTGSRFEKIAFVEGAGTTTEPQQYSYRLEAVAPGRHVFRLRQIDFDGAFTYSDEVEVEVSVAGRYYLSAAAPNPFRTQTRLLLTPARTQHVRVTAYDATGRRVAVLYDGALSAGEAHPIELRAGTLPSGLYLIRVQGEDFTAARRVVLVR